MQRLIMADFVERSKDDPFADSDLAKIASALRVSKEGPWICGGAVRRTLIEQPMDSDIDVFCANDDQRQALNVLINGLGATKLSENDFCVTYRASLGDKDRLVQIIKPVFPSVEAALESFDFTICQTGFDGNDVILGDMTLWDLGRMRLVPAKITYGVASIRRLIKYTKQGFKVCGGGIANILQQIVADPSIVNAQTQYID